MTEQINLEQHFIDPLPMTFGQQATADLLSLATLSTTQKLHDIITVQPPTMPELHLAVDPNHEASVAAWTEAIGTHGAKDVAIDAAIDGLSSLVGSLGIDPQYLDWGMRSIGMARDSAKQNDPMTTLMHLQGAKGLLNQGLAIAQLIFGKK
jgi:hypothetical protein